MKHLPAESATKTALRNATPVEELKGAVEAANYGPWSQTDMLLAELIDLARWLQWSKTKDAEKPGTQPKPYPRPGVERRPAAAAGAVPNAQVIDLLEYVRAHHGASPEGFIKA